MHFCVLARKTKKQNVKKGDCNIIIYYQNVIANFHLNCSIIFISSEVQEQVENHFSQKPFFLSFKDGDKMEFFDELANHFPDHHNNFFMICI